MKWKKRLISALLFVATAVAALMLLPSILGFKRYVIESGSMEPAIKTGSVVYSKPAPEGDLYVGDIITYDPPPDSGVNSLVTHRIHSIQPGADHTRIFRTKGDANPKPDPWVFQLNSGEAAREEATVPYLGYVYLALGVPWVRKLLIVIPAILLIVITLVSLWRETGREVEEERRRLGLEHEAEAT
jgi:signal peptidase I